MVHCPFYGFLHSSLSQGFYFFRKEVETVAGQHPLVPLLPTRVNIQRHNKVDAILEILLEYLDSRSLPIQHHIYSIGQCSLSPPSRSQQHLIPCFHYPTSNNHGFWRSIIFTQKISIRATHACSLHRRAADCG